MFTKTASPQSWFKLTNGNGASVPPMATVKPFDSIEVCAETLELPIPGLIRFRRGEIP